MGPRQRLAFFKIQGHEKGDEKKNYIYKLYTFFPPSKISVSQTTGHTVR